MFLRRGRKWSEKCWDLIPMRGPLLMSWWRVLGSKDWSELSHFLETVSTAASKSCTTTTYLISYSVPISTTGSNLDLLRKRFGIFWREAADNGGIHEDRPGQQGRTRWGRYRIGVHWSFRRRQLLAGPTVSSIGDAPFKEEKNNLFLIFDVLHQSFFPHQRQQYQKDLWDIWLWWFWLDWNYRVERHIRQQQGDKVISVDAADARGRCQFWRQNIILGIQWHDPAFQLRWQAEQEQSKKHIPHRLICILMSLFVWWLVVGILCNYFWYFKLIKSKNGAFDVCYLKWHQVGFPQLVQL